jgi:phage terminase large subunit-like protein
MAAEMTRGEKVVQFIQTYCRVPEGVLLGQPVKLLDFQKRFILDVYDNPAGTSRAYLSMARKNSKTSTIAMLLLAHLVGPEAYQNSRIISGARSRKQAAEVYNYAAKMVQLGPELRGIIKPVPSQKTLVGLPMNVEYQAIAAEAKGAHGGSPIVAILDEVGQVRGPYDAFIEAIETSQGAYAGKSLLIAISTQAPSPNDLFSRWLDDARISEDPHIVSHVHAAPEECDLMDREAWKAANPALSIFRSLQDVEAAAERATRMPTAESTFRWLYLNQRVEASTPFVSRSVWAACGGDVQSLAGYPVYAGLDLSSTADLTALVLGACIDGIWHIEPTFWLPGDTLHAKARADRVPYDIWHDQGYLLAAPGKSVDYQYVAEYLRSIFDEYDVRKVAFDRWGMKHLRPWLLQAGFTEEQLDEHFVDFGQGYYSMSPALRALEAEILNQRLAHGGHPVLTMCMGNAVVETDHAGNRKLAKHKSAGRIDGAVALAMMAGVAPLESADPLDVLSMVA